MENYGDELFKGANAKLFEFSRTLRKVSTEAEDILWQSLRRKQVNDCKFRRQHPIGKHIADFYCYEAKLVIEIDRGIHNQIENLEYDKNRTYELEQMGITVIRFTNEMIKENLSKVLFEIKEHLQKNLTS